MVVGDDRVIPFRRVRVYNYNAPYDTTWLPESRYAFWHLVSPNPSAVRMALEDDQTLTDDFYADLTPSRWRYWHAEDLYIPDIPIGRLVETPEEMTAVIDDFTSLPTICLV